MSNYRIIEKTGTYTGKITQTLVHPGVVSHHCNNPSEYKYIKEYIHRYIIQSFNGVCTYPNQDGWKELKEFNILEEARAYKRDLELADGIVIE